MCCQIICSYEVGKVLGEILKQFLGKNLIHAVAFHDRPAESIEDCFSSLTIIHTADALVSSCNPASILQDIQLDESYINKLGLSERLPLWRGLHEQQRAATKAATV